MLDGNWMEDLTRPGTGGAVGWAEIIVGHDLGFLGPEAVLAWIGGQHLAGEACQALLACGEEGGNFDRLLRLACIEAIGHPIRIGHRAWMGAQDRWRKALILRALGTERTVRGLARTLEDIYEGAGCPEDMLPLWCLRDGRRSVDFHALGRFLGAPGAGLSAA